MTDLLGRVSTADTGERNAYDFYPTPAWMTRSLLRWHPRIAGASVVEPCSGDDAITDVLRAAGCRVFTNDIDPRHPAQTHIDATQSTFWLSIAQLRLTDWVITNPPFNLAFPILVNAYAYANRGVAMLLRKSWLEPTTERGPWLAAHPPTRIIGLPRHAFRGKGSDSVSCDWCIWEHRPDRSLPPIVIDYVAKSFTSDPVGEDRPA